MSFSGVSFSIASCAAWAPTVETKEAWQAWANANYVISGDKAAPVQAMPPMLRRRAGFLGKMALEVAYQCLGQRIDVPTVFSSRHGEASRSVDLLLELENGVYQPFAWACLMRPPADEVFSLTWSDALQHSAPSFERLPAGLEILRFYLRKDPALERICNTRRWLWSRHV